MWISFELPSQPRSAITKLQMCMCENDVFVERHSNFTVGYFFQQKII